MFELLIIDDGELVINPAVFTFQEFKTIYRRRVTMDGDSDGRLKKLNLLEFMYIKYMADEYLNTNYFGAFDDNSRSKQIIKDIGLPSTWIPDSLVITAIDKYLEVQREYHPTLSSLINLQRGLKLTSKVIKTVNTQLSMMLDRLEDALSEYSNSKLNSKEEIEAVTTINSLTGGVISNMEQLFSIGKGLPAVLENITKIAKIVREEQGVAKEKRGKGGVERGDYED